MAKISDSLLFDFLSLFHLRQINLAIEVLRGRVTADQLVPVENGLIASAVIRPDEGDRIRTLEQHMRNQGMQMRKDDAMVEVRRLDEGFAPCSKALCDLGVGNGDHGEGEYA